MTAYIMKFLKATVSHTLCCFGHDCCDGSQYTISPSKTAATSKDTPLSTSIHGASVPHMVNSPGALHKILGSDSSMRGYNAIRSAPLRRPIANDSLDLGFQFGAEPSKKPLGRLEQLTRHVKQKLSESGLSRSSEQHEFAVTAPVLLSETCIDYGYDAAAQLLGQSQKSIGLSDILASRAVSEGGYDSDARSMKTPTILSDAGALQGQSKQVRGCLGPGEAKPVNDPPKTEDPSGVVASASLACSPGQMSVRLYPITQAAMQAYSVDVSHQRYKVSQTDVLQCVNNGARKETIKTSLTAELGAPHHPIDRKAELESLATLAPQRHPEASGKAMGLHKENERFGSNVRPELPTDCMLQTEAQQGTNSSAEDSVSDPAAALADCTRDSSISLPANTDVELSPPITAIKVCSKLVTDGGDAQSTTGMARTEPAHYMQPVTTSTASFEARSLHLFDMRISQRLASHSRMPDSSSKSDVNADSSGSLAIMTMEKKITSRRPSLTSRGPTFIAIEPTRRPSDPETKKLFEPSMYQNSQSRWKRSVSDGSLKLPVELLTERQPLTDDSSSFYGSVNEGTIANTSTSPHPSRRGSLKNPNSIAVSGRSASGPTAFTYGSARLLYHNNDNKHVSSAVNSSATLHASKPVSPSFERKATPHAARLPKQSKFTKTDTTPTPIVRKLRQSTDRNGQLSEIDVDHLLGGHRGVDSNVSTQAMEDRRNENLSNLDLNIIGSSIAQENSGAGSKDAWLSQGRRTGWGYDFTNNSPRKCGNDGHQDESSGCSRGTRFPVEQRDASEMWCRAFKRLGEPVDHGNLLATPQFDREGRRKDSVKSTTDEAYDLDDYTSTPMARRRSRSADLDRHVTLYDVQALRQRRKSAPLLAANDARTPRKRSFERMLRIKKRSLPGLHQRLVAGRKLLDTIRPAASRDNLGVWGRFASNTRDERSGPAGLPDEVIVRDFELGSYSIPYTRTSTPTQAPNPAIVVHSHRSWNPLKRPILSNRNTKSMTFMPSAAERAKLRRKGVLGKVRHLYRTKSSDLHTYMRTQGHRSSISTGLSIEYPELACLPGDAASDSSRIRRRSTDAGADGEVEQDQGGVLDAISEVTSKQSKSVHSYTIPWSRKDADEWSKMYQHCVGSFSALRSEDDVGVRHLGSSNVPERRVLSLTSVLRDSTANFEAELKKETDQTREALVRRFQSSEHEDETRRMPGSFS